MSRDPLVVGRVVGDVLDPFIKTTALKVTYGTRDVTNGREFRSSQVVNQPKVEVGGTALGTFYTLVMVDPDAPSPSDPNLREYLHWLVTDIPGTTDATNGQEVMCYESPRPSLGIHRVVFVLFQHLGRQTIYAPGWRQNFNTRDFGELYNLGSPVAVVYYNCQRESGSGGRRMYLVMNNAEVMTMRKMYSNENFSLCIFLNSRDLCDLIPSLSTTWEDPYPSTKRTKDN